MQIYNKFINHQKFYLFPIVIQLKNFIDSQKFNLYSHKKINSQFNMTTHDFISSLNANQFYFHHQQSKYFYYP